MYCSSRNPIREFSIIRNLFNCLLKLEQVLYHCGFLTLRWLLRHHNLSSLYGFTGSGRRERRRKGEKGKGSGVCQQGARQLMCIEQLSLTLRESCLEQVILLCSLLHFSRFSSTSKPNAVSRRWEFQWTICHLWAALACNGRHWPVPLGLHKSNLLTHLYLKINWFTCGTASELEKDLLLGERKLEDSHSKSLPAALH